MLLICEGIFFVLGLIVIFTGRFKVSRGRTVTGRRARLAGFFLMIPGPIALLGGLFLGVMYADEPFTLRNMLGTLTIIEFFAVIGSLIIAVVIGITAPESATALPSMEAMPDILTLGEAARYVRATEADVREMIESGRLRAVPIGGDYRISKEALNAAFRQADL